MRAQLLTALSIALLAGACDNPQPSEPRQSISVRSEQQNALHKLSEPSLKIATAPRASTTAAARVRP